MTSFKYYRKNDIEKKLEKARFRPLDVMVTGVTGAGKSTTLNTILKKMWQQLVTVWILKQWIQILIR